MYRIFSTKSFRQDFKKLDKDVAERIKGKLKYLSDNPGLAKPVRYAPSHMKGLCKYRIGDWRILLWINHNRKEIVLYMVEHRSSIYKRLQ